MSRYTRLLSLSLLVPFALAGCGQGADQAADAGTAASTEQAAPAAAATAVAVDDARLLQGDARVLAELIQR